MRSPKTIRAPISKSLSMDADGATGPGRAIGNYELRGHLTHFRQSQFQLLCPLARFAAGLLPLQATADASFEFRDELVGAERAARAFRVAQHSEDGEVCFSLDQIGETTEALDER